ncbi:MAG: Hsp70 family protein [Chitinophagales bacterium]
MSRYVYGVDFGTSNSALAIYDRQTNRIVHSFIDASILHFPFPQKYDGEYIVGKEGLHRFLRNSMKGRLMRSIKSALPNSSFTQTTIYQVDYTLEELVALILQSLKQKADDFVGENVTTAIFGRPVVFDEKPARDNLAQERLLKAAKIAGFQKVHFQYEPIAAAFTYERQLQDSEMVLVADLGGGTSDFTLMQLNPQKINEVDRSSDMIAKGGVHIGGDDLDAEVMWRKLVRYFGYGLQYQSMNKTLEVPSHYFRRLCAWQDLNYFKSEKVRKELDDFFYATNYSSEFQRLITLVERNLGYPLLQSIENAKIALSSQPETTIDFNQAHIEIHQSINRQEFNQFVDKDIQHIRQYLHTFLEDAFVEAEDVDSVFMTGGSSLVPVVRELFEERFGKDSIRSGDSFNSVAYGLAYSSVLF